VSMPESIRSKVVAQSRHQSSVSRHVLPQTRSSVLKSAKDCSARTRFQESRRGSDHLGSSKSFWRACKGASWSDSKTFGSSLTSALMNVIRACCMDSCRVAYSPEPRGTPPFAKSTASEHQRSVFFQRISDGIQVLPNINRRCRRICMVRGSTYQGEAVTLSCEPAVALPPESAPPLTRVVRRPHAERVGLFFHC
jgi:hypothetical protein